MKSYHVEIENETNNIIVSYEGDNFESVYDLLLDVLQAYIKKGCYRKQIIRGRNLCEH